MLNMTNKALVKLFLNCIMILSLKLDFEQGLL